MNSSTLCKHWRLDLSEEDENNPCFSDKGKLVKFTAAYVYFPSVKKTCGRIKCVLRYFRSEAENLEVWYQVQAGENPVSKNNYVKMQMFIEQL